MTKQLTASLLPTPAEVDAGKVDNVLKLQVSDIDFGYLYITEENYTITWMGNLDFHYIDESAQYFFYRQLDELKSRFEFSIEKYTTCVSIIAADKLHRFKFKYSDNPQEYRTILDDPDQITFARYDFQLSSQPGVYCFSAEKAQDASSGGGELAILLPRHQPLAKGLLRWIVKNHISFKRLRLNFDYHYNYANLVKLIKG